MEEIFGGVESSTFFSQPPIQLLTYEDIKT